MYLHSYSLIRNLKDFQHLDTSNNVMQILLYVVDTLALTRPLYNFISSPPTTIFGSKIEAADKLGNRDCESIYSISEFLRQLLFGVGSGLEYCDQDPLGFTVEGVEVCTGSRGFSGQTFSVNVS